MIYTSRFQNKAISNIEHIPIRIARYHPRFPLPYKIEGKIEILMPTIEEFKIAKMDFIRFKKIFSKRISENISAIKGTLTSLQKDGRDIVLLCYEDVNAGEQCHRRIFAEIYEKHTGIEIVEI